MSDTFSPTGNSAWLGCAAGTWVEPAGRGWMTGFALISTLHTHHKQLHLSVHQLSSFKRWRQRPVLFTYGLKKTFTKKMTGRSPEQLTQTLQFIQTAPSGKIQGSGACKKGTLLTFLLFCAFVLLIIFGNDSVPGLGFFLSRTTLLLNRSPPCCISHKSEK